jgi:hypothetical protein
VAPIVKRDEWQRAHNAMKRRNNARRGRTHWTEDPYLLRGMLACGHCHAFVHTARNQNTRYYRRPNHVPSISKRLGRDLYELCTLPDVHAVGLEAEFWNVLTDTLRDPDALRAGLEAARATHRESGSIREERLTVIGSEIVRQRKRPDTIAARMADAGDGETFQALMRQAKDIDSGSRE